MRNIAGKTKKGGKDQHDSNPINVNAQFQYG